MGFSSLWDFSAHQVTEICPHEDRQTALGTYSLGYRSKERAVARLAHNVTVRVHHVGQRVDLCAAWLVAAEDHALGVVAEGSEAEVAPFVTADT